MAHRLKLVSFELCPYVERSRIVLLEKGVPHEVELIDLANKPAWFLAVSPMGRVPVLLVDDRPIFESMVINELLDELHPRPPLFPADPIARAEARGWIVFANDVVMPASLAAMTSLAGGPGGDDLARPLGALREAFAKLEAQVARGRGPFLLGEPFTLADAAYAPFFRRWQEAEGWGGPRRGSSAPSPRCPHGPARSSSARASRGLHPTGSARASGARSRSARRGRAPAGDGDGAPVARARGASSLSDR